MVYSNFRVELIIQQWGSAPCETPSCGLIVGIVSDLVNWLRIEATMLRKYVNLKSCSDHNGNPNQTEDNLTRINSIMN